MPDDDRPLNLHEKDWLVKLLVGPLESMEAKCARSLIASGHVEPKRIRQGEPDCLLHLTEKGKAAADQCMEEIKAKKRARRELRKARRERRQARFAAEAARLAAGGQDGDQETGTGGQ